MTVLCARCFMRGKGEVAAPFVVAGESRCEYHLRAWFGADMHDASNWERLAATYTEPPWMGASPPTPEGTP